MRRATTEVAEVAATHEPSASAHALLAPYRVAGRAWSVARRCCPSGAGHGLQAAGKHEPPYPGVDRGAGHGVDTDDVGRENSGQPRKTAVTAFGS